jgi:hypothetical protein
MVKHHNPIAGLKLRNLSASCDNDASGLMAEDARGGMRAGGDLFEIGPADAAGVNTDEKLARADFRNGDFFQSNVIDAAIDGSPHGQWQGAFAQSPTVLCSYRHSGFVVCVQG